MLKDREHIGDALKRFQAHVIKEARKNLTNQDKNVTRKLYNTLSGGYKVYPNSISIFFDLGEYGDFQDKGVKGAKSSYKAPKSPYKFGSGTGRKGGLTEGIFEWVQKRRFQFKDKQGRFMSYKSTAWLITRSIYAKGIKPSLFFTKPFESAFKNLPDDLVETFGLIIEEQFTKEINKI